MCIRSLCLSAQPAAAQQRRLPGHCWKCLGAVLAPPDSAAALCCHLLDAGRYCRHCPRKGPQCVPGTADDARRRAVVSPGAPQCSLGCSRCFPERPRGLSRANLCAQRNASVLPELLYVFSGGFQVCPRCLQDAPSII